MPYDYSRVTVESVNAETDAALERADALIGQAVGSVKVPSFETTLQRMEHAVAAIGEGFGRGAFFAQVHTDAAVRDAAQAAEERINKWRVALTFRSDLYAAVRSFSMTEEADTLDGERRRLLEFWLRDFRRAGHELEPDERAELERLRTRLVELEVAFQRNVNEYRDGIEVTRDELDGLPDEYVDRLAPGDTPGTYFVSLDYPQLNPFLEQAHDRSLREELFRKHWNRTVEANRPLLAEAIRLRQQIAALLGHPSWAHFGMELKMAQSPDRVAAFYDELLPAVASATTRDLQEMTPLLAAESGNGDPINAWDWRYYDEQMRRSRFGVDQNVVSEYFPLDSVMEGMFAITGEVFGLTYRRVPEARSWDSTVELYEILDRDSGEPIASFFTDLFPREGKFGHAAAWALSIGHRRPDGEYERPVSAMVANFTPAAGDRPALLTHNEVETLFHEFGHILHMSLTRAEFARFSAAETEWDFVEAPSQIMEHWVWDASVLQRFARHYRSGEPIPGDLVAQMVAARNLNIGLRTSVQAFYGGLDLTLHAGDEEPDLDAALRTSYGVTGMPYPEGTFMLSGFAHLMGGYDAGYYGYLWAEVIGDDMFSRFSSEGILSPDVGAQYRREILEPNGARSADEMVRAFLGRDASSREYLRLRGMLPAD